MAQALIDLIGSVRKCKYCDKTFKSEAGENNHMKRLHPLDMESDARCWTCNKPFTKRQLLYQHFSTVQHQINCKKLQEGEIPEIEEKPEEIQPIERNTGNKGKTAYRRRLMERPIRIYPYVRKPISTLRSSPAIIPLEATMPQADPRTDPKVSFLDLIEIEAEIEDTSRSTKDTLKEAKTEEELKTEVEEDSQTTKHKDNPETPQIQKQNTSRSELLQAKSTTPQSNDKDMNTAKKDKCKVPDTETRPNPETTAEIHPGIYPTTRSTTCTAPPASTSSPEETTEIQIHPTQKHSKLSNFEETIVEMFNLPKNIKELVPVSSPLPDLDLQTEPQLPLEEFSLLDYLNDSNII